MNNKTFSKLIKKRIAGGGEQNHKTVNNNVEITINREEMKIITRNYLTPCK